MRLPQSEAFPRFLLPSLPVNIAVQRCPTSRREAPQRIVIVKFGALGDILMATPLLTALRRAYPEAHITWVAEDTNLGAIDTNPHIDEILLWSSGYWQLMRSSKPRNWIRNQFGFRWPLKLLRLKWLLHRRFDTFISFHPERWNFLRSAAAPRTSLGIFESPDQAKRDYTSRYTKAYTAADFSVHRTNNSLLPLGALSLPPATDKQMILGFTAEDDNAARDFLKRHDHPDGQEFLLLAPMTTWESRVWPAENYVQLGNALAKQGRRLVLISSPHLEEREAVSAIASQMQVPPMTALGTLTFRQMAALMARASLLISSDTGPMHAAAAVGTPYLALFGPTPVLGRAPLAGRGLALAHAVPCGPCDQQVCPNPPETYMKCMHLLTVSEVLDAVTEVLDAVTEVLDAVTGATRR